MAKVLLADDEEALRLLMGRQLQRAGHEVTLAEDGLVAAAFLEKEDFDVVVSDMKMPRLDGMGLLERAKQIAPNTEFIILTGHGSMDNAVDAFKTGNVFDYLLKPLEDIQELDAVVARADQRRRLLLENARLVGDLEARVNELEEARSRLAELAEHDSLTGLLNHRMIHEKLQSALDLSTDRPVSVTMIDMDGFKLFNDTYGHPVGDQVLRHIAATLRQVCGENAFLGRCGGDEFMTVLPGMNVSEAGSLADRIRQNLSSHPFCSPGGDHLPIRLCFGIADTDGAGRSAPNLVAASDAALYTGKQHGGDIVSLYRHHDAEGDNENRSAFDVLDGLVTAIDHKDRYTRLHSEQVTNYALKLARTLELSEETCDAVRLAGLLHDVGKIGVPDAILRKPGRLTPEEYETMKNHVTISALIIHGLPRLADILDGVAYHHERWDGKGYPKGLQGEQIPLLGRIMAIADAFSAMTVDRPYRTGLSIDDALLQIEQGAGTQFDPNLAPLFVRAMRENNVHDAVEFLRAA